MKCLKTLGPVTLTVAALLAVTASASATQLTSPAGTVYTGSVRIESVGPIVLHGFVEHTCNKVVIEANVEQHGAAFTTAGQVTTFDVTECNNVDMFVIKRGTLQFHTSTASADGNGTATLSGVEITYVITSIFGNIHCTMEGPEVDLGTITGSKNTPGGTTAEVPPRPIKDPTNVFCPHEVDWTGLYKFTKPHYLDVD